MGTILGMLRRMELVNTDLIIYQAMKESEGDLADINKEQMYDGKTREGIDIRPSYFEDPYFKTRAQAQAYSDWKDDITPNIRRNPGTPNLFINGFFYSSIHVTILPDTITYTSSWAEGDDIEHKFKNIYGLGSSYKEIFVNQYLRGLLTQKLKEETKLKFSQ